MKIKHHPGIIEDPYPELALVIIKLNGAIISTGKKKNHLWPQIHFSEMKFTAPFLFTLFLVARSCHSSSSSWTFIAIWPAALSMSITEHTEWIVSSTMIPMIKKEEKKN